MVTTRPDIRSYSRVSYLREIHGDVPGAIQAIQQAVAAGYPGYEDTEWARMVLAHLYEQTNQLEKAENEYKTALAERPDYPFALAGLGRIARYKKDYPTAIEHLEKAKDVMADAAFFEELIDLYRLNNQPEQSAICARATIEAMVADNITAEKDKDLGHYSDRELAALYFKTGDFGKALHHAKTEQQRRPQNVDACETLAWALYKNKQADQAAPLMATALRTNAQDPERFVKAGLIMLANGQSEEGKVLINKGLALKPYMDEGLAAEARAHIGG
jgi:tetratricopeptide (TPR) repeat protein